ncbi:uncharacterized protein V1513DRAFT_127143 [Lipomyces chichibuensis]|uniref:uncharacterized protein n=1 Tax=Lipomyces chichibuensis TaxID=1546026 RepID=UPI003344078E
MVDECDQRFEQRIALLKHARLDHGFAVDSDEEDIAPRRTNSQNASGPGLYSEYCHSGSRGLMSNHISPYYHTTAPAYRKSALVSAHIFGPMPASSHQYMDLHPGRDHVNGNYYREDENRATSGFSSRESSYSENLLTSDAENAVHNRMSSAAGFRPQLPAASPLSSSSFFYDAASRHLQNPENNYQYQHTRCSKFHLSDNQLPNSQMMNSHTNFQNQNCLTTQARSEEHGYTAAHVIGGSDWM